MAARFLANLGHCPSASFRNYSGIARSHALSMGWCRKGYVPAIPNERRPVSVPRNQRRAARWLAAAATALAALTTTLAPAIAQAREFVSVKGASVNVRQQPTSGCASRTTRPRWAGSMRR
jgi:hypothetical protein